MISQKNSAWLGFASLGERVGLDPSDLKRGVSILGRGAERMGLLTALALSEAGTRVLFLDLSGEAARQLSGYINAVDASTIMLDAFKLEEGLDQFHAQLVSSALTTMFNLPANQESILNAALIGIAEQGGIASPSAIFDGTSMVSAHRPTDKQELLGRLESLRLLTTETKDATVEGLLGDDAIVSFSNAISPEIAEAGVVFTVAKVLALARRDGTGPGAIVMDEAHRIFRSQRFVHHSRRFQNSLFASRVGKLFVTEFDVSLDEQIAGACAVRLLSSSVWNLKEDDKILDGSFVLQDTSRGTTLALAPGRFDPLGGNVTPGAPPKPIPPDLTLEILEAVGTNELATKPSVAAWLSVDYDRDEVSREIDRLVRELLVTLMAPPTGNDVSTPVLHLTQLGELEMRRLKSNE